MTKETETKKECPRCNVALLPGKAMVPAIMASPDFQGDDCSGTSCTMSPGPGVLADVVKCPECGYSLKA